MPTKKLIRSYKKNIFFLDINPRNKKRGGDTISAVTGFMSWTACKPHLGITLKFTQHTLLHCRCASAFPTAVGSKLLNSPSTSLLEQVFKNSPRLLEFSECRKSRQWTWHQCHPLWWTRVGLLKEAPTVELILQGKRQNSHLLDINDFTLLRIFVGLVSNLGFGFSQIYNDYRNIYLLDAFLTLSFH